MLRCDCAFGFAGPTFSSDTVVSLDQIILEESFELDE